MAHISDEAGAFLPQLPTENNLRIAKGSFALFPKEILAVFWVSDAITKSATRNTSPKILLFVEFFWRLVASHRFDRIDFRNLSLITGNSMRESVI